LFYISLHNKTSDTETQFAQDDAALNVKLSTYNDTSIAFEIRINQSRACIDELCANGTFPELLENVILRGCWNAATNTPMLNDTNGEMGDLYVVCVGGNSTTLNGVSEWLVDDLIKRVEDDWITLPKDGVTLYDDPNGTGVSLIVNEVGDPLEVVQLSAIGNLTLVDQGDYINLLLNVSTPGSQVIPYGALGLIDTVPDDVNGTNITVTEQMWTHVGDDLHMTLTVRIPPTYNSNGTEYVVPIDGFFTIILPVLPTFPHNPWCGLHRTVAAGTTPDNIQLKISGSHFETGTSPEQLDIRWRVDYTIGGSLSSPDPYYIKMYCVWADHTPPSGPYP
jgi:hypothetical protein